MVAMQQTPYAPGLGDQRQFPGHGQGQTFQPPAAVPKGPIAPEERAQQLRNMHALGERFPLWCFWFQGRTWSATRYTGERVVGGSAEEIAAQVSGTAQRKSAPPMPPPAGPPSVPRPVSQLRQPQGGLQHPPSPPQQQPQGWPQYPSPPQQHAPPVPQASGAA